MEKKVSVYTGKSLDTYKSLFGKFKNKVVAKEVFSSLSSCVHQSLG